MSDRELTDREILIDLTFKLLSTVGNQIAAEKKTQSPDLSEIIAESAAYAKEILDHVDAQLEDDGDDDPDDGEEHPADQEEPAIEMIPAPGQARGFRRKAS